jgi:hypothetical protein
VSRPLMVDLFCGAGGSAVGYDRAGFTVIGWDKFPQPNYPFEFHQGDALEVMADLDYMARFDAASASPTCQGQARVTDWRGSRDNHPDTLTPTLTLLGRVEIPWVVENVPEAAVMGRMRADHLLCGSQFGLAVRRHRIFQTGNWSDFQLVPPCWCIGNPRTLPFMHKGERAYADAMGCGWMSSKEARQAIPPAYTEFIGGLLMNHLQAKTA